MMATYGVDISSYQRSVDYHKYGFYIIKASEGRTLKDPMLDRHYNAVKAAGKPYGFYHYARPENNSWKAEADHFLSLVGHHAHKAIFALDWEGNALRYNYTWALNWLSYVWQKTGVRPLFYCPGSALRRYPQIAKANFGLWVASYGVKAPQKGAWPDYAIWQYSDKPMDMDVLNGDTKTWNAYAGITGGGQSKPAPTPKPAPAPAKKSNAAIAAEVLAGKWGNGNDRKVKLAAAGYDYNAIQAEVNKRLGASGQKKAAAKVCYTVRRGDTLSKIAAKYKTTWQKLQKLNGIRNANKIYVGQVIRVK
ncbi:GH25 family lysozyme [Pseudoramibacter alactolyticus]|uniref:GH25 family lysozyme n=1 Tax=Pseudoramibacter alactolyticus TaxID=113287 RepID=UPI0028ED4894|nr:GH25 family lysozyme [Pseudoramibacter alactolyticus]